MIYTWTESVLLATGLVFLAIGLVTIFIFAVAGWRCL